MVAIDDEPEVLAIVERLLARRGFVVSTFEDAENGIERLRAGPAVDLLVTDVHLPGKTGLDVLREAREHDPTLPVVVMTGRATIESAVEAMRLGAYDYIVKPFDPPELLASTAVRALEYRRLRARNQFLERRLRSQDRFEGIVAASEPMRTVFDLVDAVAGTDASVLIFGESGTGKELVARAIHERSLRSAKTFVALNCAALTETLLESELFGHVKGSFTGAASARQGLFEEASGGTLFLDEVGELAKSTQAMLLRVLQEGEVRRVGSNEARRVDVRIVGATHRDLKEAVQENEFREDLYYRLNVFSISIPPLRDRPDDIPLLVQHFIEKHSRRLGKEVRGVDSSAMEILLQRDWPGNVRELENVVQRALILAKTDAIRPADVAIAPSTAHPAVQVRRLVPYSEARATFELEYLQRALDLAGGSPTNAAKLAGLDRSNFRRMLKRHQIGED